MGFHKRCAQYMVRYRRRLVISDSKKCNIGIDVRLLILTDIAIEISVYYY